MKGVEGRKSFNLDVPDRIDLMQRLLDGESVGLNGGSEPVRNIASRYDNYAGLYPVPIRNGRQIAATVRINYCTFTFTARSGSAKTWMCRSRTGTSF